MTTPDGWQVELVRFGPDPAFRLRSGHPSGRRTGVVVGLEDLVSVLGDSFELLERVGRAGDARPVPADA